MKLTELIAAAGGEPVTPRFVRFLIAEGILDPPSGGRAHADYAEAHLHGVLNYVRLRKLGFSLTQVKEIVRAGHGETVPVSLGPGLALHVDLTQLARGTVPAAVAERVQHILSELLATLNTEGKRDADAP